MSGGWKIGCNDGINGVRDYTSVIAEMNKNSDETYTIR
jgi:hypothetical protein